MQVIIVYVILFFAIIYTTVKIYKLIKNISKRNPCKNCNGCDLIKNINCYKK